MGDLGVYFMIPAAIAVAVFVILRLYRFAFGWGSLEDGVAAGRSGHHVSSRNQWGFPTVGQPGKVASGAGVKTKEPWGW